MFLSSSSSTSGAGSWQTVVVVPLGVVVSDVPVDPVDPDIVVVEHTGFLVVVPGEVPGVVVEEYSVVVSEVMVVRVSLSEVSFSGGLL